MYSKTCVQKFSGVFFGAVKHFLENVSSCAHESELTQNVKYLCWNKKHFLGWFYFVVSANLFWQCTRNTVYQEYFFSFISHRYTQLHVTRECNFRTFFISLLLRTWFINSSEFNNSVKIPCIRWIISLAKANNIQHK